MFRFGNILQKQKRTLMDLRGLLGLFVSSLLTSLNGATFVVTNTADAGQGSLRWAVHAANATPELDSVTFSNTRGVITLSSPITMLQPVCISGPYSNLVTLSGGVASRVLSVGRGADVSISDLTIADGLAPDNESGGGIYNAGNLHLMRCVISNNYTRGGFGGGIYNEGKLFMGSSVVASNTADGAHGVNGSGGGGGFGGGCFTMSGYFEATNSTFANNRAVGGNGGPSGWNGKGAGQAGGEPGLPGGFGAGGGSATRLGQDGGIGGYGGGGGCGANNQIAGNWSGAEGGYGGGRGGGPNGGNPGGGGGGAGIGGAIFLHSGVAFLAADIFTNNSAAGGSGGGNPPPLYGGHDGSGLDPDLHRFSPSAQILPRLTVVALGEGSIISASSAAPYLNHSLAALIPIEEDGWTFLEFFGDATGTNSAVTLTVTRNMYVEGVFGVPLTLGPDISASPQAALYPYGTQVRLTAVPPAGQYFLDWTGAASGSTNPTTLLIGEPSPPEVGCAFADLPPGQLSLTILEHGQGVVEQSPVAAYYADGEKVLLTAIPNPGQTFLGWSGDGSGSANPLSVVIDRSKSVTARFSNRPTLRVGTRNEGLVDGCFRLTLFGELGGRYSIQSSTNLIEWTGLGTVETTYGRRQINDVSLPSPSFRFYRALQE